MSVANDLALKQQPVISCLAQKNHCPVRCPEGFDRQALMDTSHSNLLCCCLLLFTSLSARSCCLLGGRAADGEKCPKPPWKRSLSWQLQHFVHGLWEFTCHGTCSLWRGERWGVTITFLAICCGAAEVAADPLNSLQMMFICHGVSAGGWRVAKWV